MRLPVRTILTAAVFASLAVAAHPARADEASEAAARLAAHAGFRAKIEARDSVAGRTYTATILFRAPDHALALIPPGEWVAIDGGKLAVLEEGVLHTCDVAAWLRRTGASIAPLVAEARALSQGQGDAASAPAPPPFDLVAAADRLGVSLEVDLRRLERRVAIALVLTHSFDAAAREAPGFAYHTSDATEVAYAAASGFPETVRLRGVTGRVDGEVRLVSFERLTSVPDALIAPPATTLTAEEVDPAPRLKESVVRHALAAILGPLRAGGARDAGLLDREEERVKRVLVDAYTALFRAGYDERRLRAEARRAVQSDSAVVLAAFASAGLARKGQVRDALRDRFGANCRRQLKDAVGELVRLVEGTLAPAEGAPKADEAARKRLLGATPGAALAAFERAIVAPMEAEAAAEIDRLSSRGAESGGARSQGGGVAAAGIPEGHVPATSTGDKRP